MSDSPANLDQPATARRPPLRLLVVCPSWVGDVVMATPALRLLRSRLPGSFIGGLVRPGLDELLAGADFFDELHVDRARGMMGPKHVAAKIRPRRYDAAVLFTNSFSTALITRLAFIPRRVGYDRDGRGLLLTDKLKPERSARGWACVSAVEYYLRAAREVVGEEQGIAGAGGQGSGREKPRLELGVTVEQEAAGRVVLEKASVRAGHAYAVLNPGANNPAKRWPTERFAAVGAHLVKVHGFKVLVNGSSGEAELCDAVVGGIGAGAFALPRAGITIGALKHVVRGARAMVTNDTGPRHIAAAFGVPVVTLFGPTDPRWTTLPEGASAHAEVAAGPEGGLPKGEIADDHPDECRIGGMGVERVVEAVEGVLKP